MLDRVTMSYSEAKKAGVAFYFTGKPCKYGHISQRYASGGRCRICSDLTWREWERNNRSRRRALKRKWRKANPEKTKAAERRSFLKNPERVRAKDRRRNKKVERQRATADSSRRWRHRDPERARLKIRRWIQEHPLAIKAIRQARRSRKKSAEGHFSADDIARIFKQQKGRCAFYCDCRYSFQNNEYHIDHIIPLSKNGSNWPNNIQLLCAPCNVQKSKTDPIEYAQRKGRML